jgi:hypothetical protein
MNLSGLSTSELELLRAMEKLLAERIEDFAIPVILEPVTIGTSWDLPTGGDVTRCTVTVAGWCGVTDVVRFRQSVTPRGPLYQVTTTVRVE